mgnify:CR=1 FL=1
MPIRTLHADDYPVDRLIDAKGDQRVAVCLPARNEADTVGTIVATIVDGLGDSGLIDDIVVVDDHSEDDTAAVAAAAGARVIRAADDARAPGPGKGQALWKSVLATDADIIAWCDADLAQFSNHFVTGLVGPLLCDQSLSFVKATYHRPLVDGHGGGRVTELLARPALSLLFPEVAGVDQPLAGEYAARRDVLLQVPFVADYGVDIALLIDVVDRVGVDGLCQVDLGQRHHRNRPLHELSVQATEVLAAVLARAEATGRSIPDAQGAVLRRPGRSSVVVTHRELAAIATLAVDDHV